MQKGDCTDREVGSPISYSEWNLYATYPERYYQTYIIGLREPPTREMELGTIIHQSVLEGANYLKLLREAHFTSDVSRNVATMVSWPGWVNIPKREQKLVTGVLQAKLDGVDEGAGAIWELKTGKAFWTQERVDQHDQLTFYAMVYELIHGVIPRLFLISANVGNGKIKVFETTRDSAQLQIMKITTDAMHDELVRKGWWNKRKKYDNQNQRPSTSNGSLP